MTVFLLYQNFYDCASEKIHIGGVETYIINLLDVLSEMEIPTKIIQLDEEYTLQMNLYVEIISLKKNNSIKEMLAYAERNSDLENDLLLFMDCETVRKTKFKSVIAIQHGIGFDFPWINGYVIPDIFAGMVRFLQARRRLYRHKYISKLVCVDYNYMNWVRTQTLNRTLNYIVIPNFTNVPEYVEKSNRDTIKIVYARRITEGRGAKLIKNVFKELVKRYNHVTITIAGTGVCLNELKSSFKGQKQISFTTYDSKDSIVFHKQFDIAIVPSIASEGTSLSLLEAMAAGCAVVATDIGGMTNIILNDYNGKMCRPDENECIDALVELIESKEKRDKLSKNAYQTVCEAFSIEKWKESWKKVFREFLKS